MAPVPSPAEIVKLAAQLGYSESRSQVSATIFLVRTDDDDDDTQTKIHIYYTTQSIMTLLNHPSQGVNRLWRSHAYQTLDELKEFLLDPRLHTQKGYRQASNAVRVCTKCNELKARTDFSKNQWVHKGPDLNVCKTCVLIKKESKQPASTNHDDDDTDVQLAGLTDNLLHIHNTQDQQQSKNKKKGGSRIIQNRMERRQFNCPDCPRHGRGPFVFCKRVPVVKPIVKCPQCKQASRGKCARLYPVPIAKGYGLFSCPVCKDKWGSSRAVEKTAQECFSCFERDGQEGTMVIPFRIEVLKKKKRTGAGRPRRVPREPIREDDVDEAEYTESDRFRHDTEAGNALVRGNNNWSYKTQDDSEDSSFAASSQDSDFSGPGWVVVGSSSRIPKGYRHKCAGCKTGACKSRRIPVSEIHDVSDGNTVSTSASLVTNSSIDKAEYVDRDEDFSGFEDNWEPEE